MCTLQLLTLSLFILLQVSAQGPQSQGGQSYYCPNSCSSSYGYGSCSTSERQCICNEGYFDTDCSQKVTQLKNGVAKTISISPESWGYFYIDLSTVPADAVLTFESSQASLYYYLLLEGSEEYYLPSEYFTKGLSVSSSKTSQTYTIKQSVLEYSDGGWLLIGAANVDTSNSVSLTVKNTWSTGDSDSSSNSLVLIIAISIGIVAFLIVCFITAYTCRKRRLMREQIAEINQNNENPNRLPNVQGRSQPNATDFLKKEELNGYFPVKGFHDMKSSFDQTSCSICLDDYNSKSVCRQLYCEHIFHGECIEEWLAKHTECPNCKSEMTKKSIKEFYKKKVTEKKPSTGPISNSRLSVKRIPTKQDADASVVVEIPMENIANAAIRRNQSREVSSPMSPVLEQQPNSGDQMNVSVMLSDV